MLTIELFGDLIIAAAWIGIIVGFLVGFYATWILATGRDLHSGPTVQEVKKSSNTVHVGRDEFRSRSYSGSASLLRSRTMESRELTTHSWGDRSGGGVGSKSVSLA